MVADPYISEFQTTGVGSNFVEIRVDEGFDVSSLRVAYYDNEGEQMVSVNLGAIDGGGATGDVYVVTAGPVNEAAAFALYDTGTGQVLQFVSSGTRVTARNGSAKGLTSDNVGTHSGSQSMQSDDGGLTYYTQTSPNPGSAPPPCFLAGTLLSVPGGRRRVETLRTGDLVETTAGPRPVRWIARHPMGFDPPNARHRPWRIVAPDGRRLDLSPQHRVLVDCDGLGPGLLAACRVPGARQRRGVKSAVYFHLLLDDHGIVEANGIAVETLLIGERAGMILPASAPRHLSRRPAAQILKRAHLRAATGRARVLAFDEARAILPSSKALGQDSLWANAVRRSGHRRRLALPSLPAALDPL